MLESARQYGVSHGKYLCLEQLIEVDPSLNMADYTHHTINQLKEQIDECASSHPDGEHETPNHH